MDKINIEQVLDLAQSNPDAIILVKGEIPYNLDFVRKGMITIPVTDLYEIIALRALVFEGQEDDYVETRTSGRYEYIVGTYTAWIDSLEFYDITNIDQSITEFFSMINGVEIETESDMELGWIHIHFGIDPLFSDDEYDEDIMSAYNKLLPAERDATIYDQILQGLYRERLFERFPHNKVGNGEHLSNTYNRIEKYERLRDGCLKN